MRWLRKHGLVRGNRSRWGREMPFVVAPGHEPQRLMDAGVLQRRLVECAHGTPSPGEGLCASWVEQAFSRLGLGVVLGNAAEIYNGYCNRTDTIDLKVGMVVSVPAHPFTAQGLACGHVGLYAGDDMMMDAVGETVRKVPLELWLSTYGLMAEPRWGWLGTIRLG